jgi:hypothetical protein
VSNEHYLHNALIHQDRRLGNSGDAWVRQFDCTHIKPLIICRGPIRKEAMDVFAEMGINDFGILLSEKDSIVYRGPWRLNFGCMDRPTRVHRVRDYSAVLQGEREHAFDDIIRDRSRPWL